MYFLHHIFHISYSSLATMTLVLPNDVLRKIYITAVRARNEDIVRDIVNTFANAFDLVSSQTNADYKTPMFAGSSDIARVSMVYDDSFARTGLHHYSMFVEVGDEMFCLYKDDYEYHNEIEESDVKLFIALKESSKKYETIAIETFRAMFSENSVVY